MYKIITFISTLMLPVLTLIISIYVGKIKIIQSRQKVIIISLCVLTLIFAVITIVERNKKYEKQGDQIKELQETEEFNSQLL